MNVSPGSHVTFYGREYHIHSCDDFTRTHLEAEGVKQPDDINDHDEKDEGGGGIETAAVPKDEYTERRARADAAAASYRRKKEPAAGAAGAATAATERGKLRKYLDNDGKVLRLASTIWALIVTSIIPIPTN